MRDSRECSVDTYEAFERGHVLVLFVTEDVRRVAAFTDPGFEFFEAQHFTGNVWKR